MYCEKCGEKNLDGASRCKKCGNILLKEEIDAENANEETLNKKEDNVLDNASIKLCECGNLIQDDWDMCPACGRKLDRKVFKEKKEHEIEGPGGNILMIIFIACYIFPHLLTGFVTNYEYVFIIFRVTCLLLILTAKIKYPENKNVKLLFWLFIIAVLINIVRMILTHSIEWIF